MSRPKAFTEFAQAGDQQRADRLAAELQLVKTKLRAVEKERHAQDRLLEYARLALDALPLVKAPAPAPKPERHTTHESAVLLGSCYHIGETIREAELDGLNAYDFDVFCCRFQRKIDTTIKFLTENMAGYIFDALHVIHTGDLVSGEIHSELSETNCINIVEQATLGALVVAQGLRELAARFPKIIFTGVVGNHGRTRAKPYFKRKQQLNWDYIAFNYIALLCRDIPNVRFHIQLSPWATEVIQGYAFHISHGDSIRSQFSIPYYGLHRDTAVHFSLAAARRQFLHYFIRSHFHTYASLQTTMGETILNGSIKGTCDYGVHFGGNEPLQLLFGVHKKHGVSWRLPINCRIDAPKSARYTYTRDRSLAEQVEQQQAIQR